MRRSLRPSRPNSLPNGVLKIVDGLVCILSLGLAYSSLEMSYIEWLVRHRIKRMRRKETSR